MHDDLASSDAAALDEGALRPTRAELRRAREAAAALEVTEALEVTGGESELLDPASTTPVVVAATAAIGAETLSRTAIREAKLKAEREERKARGFRGLLTAWWFYPLVAAIAVCVYLGYRTTVAPPPPPGPIVVTTPTPEN
jgi:hypothetical protein